MNDYEFSYEDYKKRVYKNPGLSFYIIGFFVILLLGLAFLLWPKPNGKAAKTVFYFVEVDNFVTYKDANALAGVVQSRFGAGFVYFDTSYHVLASFYPNLDMANSVVGNLIGEFPNVKTFELSCNKFLKHANLLDKQNEIVANTIVKNVEIIDKIYNNILNFDKNEINISILKQNFTIISSNYGEIFNDIKGCFSRNSKYFKTVQNIENIYDTLNSFNSYVENNEIFKLKYGLIKIVVEHCEFVNTF